MKRNIYIYIYIYRKFNTAISELKEDLKKEKSRLRNKYSVKKSEMSSEADYYTSPPNIKSRNHPIKQSISASELQKHLETPPHRMTSPRSEAGTPHGDNLDPKRIHLGAGPSPKSNRDNWRAQLRSQEMKEEWMEKLAAAERKHQEEMRKWQRSQHDAIAMDVLRSFETLLTLELEKITRNMNKSICTNNTKSTIQNKDDLLHIQRMNKGIAQGIVSITKDGRCSSILDCYKRKLNNVFLKFRALMEQRANNKLNKVLEGHDIDIKELQVVITDLQIILHKHGIKYKTGDKENLLSGRGDMRKAIYLRQSGIKSPKSNMENDQPARGLDESDIKEYIKCMDSDYEKDIISKISPIRNQEGKYVVDVEKVVRDLLLVKQALYSVFQKASNIYIYI